MEHLNDLFYIIMIAKGDDLFDELIGSELDKVELMRKYTQTKRNVFKDVQPMTIKYITKCLCKARKRKHRRDLVNHNLTLQPYSPA